MKPGEAVMKLSRIGFRFRLDGEAVKVSFVGEQPQDPEAASPLLDLMRQHKSGVADFLRCHCPRCGGCCFIPDYEGRSLCMACDWQILIELYPGLRSNN
jgi:hypothetical protein